MSSLSLTALCSSIISISTAEKHELLEQIDISPSIWFITASCKSSNQRLQSFRELSRAEMWESEQALAVRAQLNRWGDAIVAWARPEGWPEAPTKVRQNRGSIWRGFALWRWK
jgi:hypothetical protein